MALTGSINLTTNWTQTPANIPGALPDHTQLNLNWQVASGTATEKADQKFALVKSLAATPWAINLLTDLVDKQGVAFVPARVKALVVHNLSTTAGQVVLLGYATTTANAWAGPVSNPGQVTIRPSTANCPGLLCLAAPDAAGYLVDATHKLLQLDPGANTISVEVEIICSSA